MRRVPISVYVDGDLADALETRAQMAGLSRSAFCERLLAQEAEGGDKRVKRNLAFLVTGMHELLHHVSPAVQKEARRKYDELIERENLKDHEPVEDQRRAARRS